MTNQKLLVSKQEAAQMLSLSVRAIERLIRRRHLDVVQVGRRVLIPVKSLAAFAASGDGAGPSQVN
jgi:excisionase family DNA binding protein